MTIDASQGVFVSWWAPFVAVVRCSRGLIYFCGGLCAILGIFSVYYGSSGLVIFGLQVAGLMLGGLIGSYALHEFAHWAVLRRLHGVTSIRVTSSAWRVSVEASGTFSPRESIMVALAGPGICVLVGIALLNIMPGVGLIFLTHSLQLLPFWGDGRVVRQELKRYRRERALHKTATASSVDHQNRQS